MSHNPVEQPSTIELLLTPEQAAKILNVSMSSLAKSRVDGDGPEFVKIGRAVRYLEIQLAQIHQNANANVNHHVMNVYLNT